MSPSPNGGAPRSRVAPLSKLRQAAEGRSLFSPAEWRSVGQELRLSDREFQIVQAIFDDESESSIARKLGISAHTVHTYLERLYRKCMVNSRVGLVVRVFGEYLFLRDSASGDAPNGSDPRPDAGS